MKPVTRAFVGLGFLGISTFSLGACDSKADAAPENPSAEATTEKRVTVTVTEKGYSPSEVQAQAGEPLTLVFKRTTDAGCGHEIVFPDRNIKRSLPLNEEVEVKLTPKRDERIAFTCGMNMHRGSIVATK